MGWTLGSYIFRRYATITTWMFAGTFALIFIIDFAEFTSRMAAMPDFTFPRALAVIALRVPMFMVQTVPFVALFSAMAVMIALNRRSELVVARAAGVSVWQLLMPLSIGALLFGLFMVFVVDPLAAGGLARSELVEADMKSASGGNGADIVPWLRQTANGEDTIVGAKSTLSRGTELVDASFFKIDKDGNIFERLDARRASLKPGYWELVDVDRYTQAEHQTGIPTARIATNLREEFVQDRLARPETIPIYDLPKKMDVARSFGVRADAFGMQFHSLIALPLLLVAMTVIAATVSLRFARQGQSASLILGGVVAGFLLYVVSVLVKAFGGSGIVPPVVAAWFPVIVAVLLGVTLLLYREDG